MRGCLLQSSFCWLGVCWFRLLGVWSNLVVSSCASVSGFCICGLCLGILGLGFGMIGSRTRLFGYRLSDYYSHEELQKSDAPPQKKRKKEKVNSLPAFKIIFHLDMWTPPGTGRPDQPHLRQALSIRIRVSVHNLNFTFASTKLDTPKP